MSNFWIIDDLAYICKKKAMKYASEDYSSNMSGSSYVSQFLKKKKRKPKDGGDQEVSMSCSEHGCSAYDSGGGGSNAGQSSYKGGGSSGSVGVGGGEKNVVLTKKQADKRAKQFEKFREEEKKKHTAVPKSKF